MSKQAQSKPQQKSLPTTAVKNSGQHQCAVNVGVYACKASAGKGWTGGKYKGL